MSLNSTPAAERVHIAFFGVRNVGKSSVVNAVTGQELSIVSDMKGTTTDPVKKTMELLPIGPVVIIDTPGIDDVGALGEERVRRTKRILNQTDIAVLVVSAADSLQEADRELLALFETKQIPYLIALNKVDLLDDSDRVRMSTGTLSGRSRLVAHAAALSSPSSPSAGGAPTPDNCTCELTDTESHIAEFPSGTANSKNQIPSKTPCASGTLCLVSAKTGEGIEELKEALGRMAREAEHEQPLVADLVNTGDLVVLVVPIDKSAPKGRLILPQQMVIRGLLDAGAVPVIVRDTEYAALQLRPALVITDSQVFEKIAALTPDEIPLTSFSMLMARYKGGLAQAVRGAKALHSLQDGDTILISEGCTHHRQCEDIGTVKFPRWLQEFTGKDLQFAFTSGADFPEDLSPYALVIHCGGCMLNEREMRSRMHHADDEDIPMTNYGVAIAEIHGILERCTAPLL